MRDSVRGGAPLDPVLLVPLAVAIAVAVGLLVVLRARQVRRAEEALHKDEASLEEIERQLHPFTSTEAYIPERVRRALGTELGAMVGQSLPSTLKVLRRVKGRNLSERAEKALCRAEETVRVLQQHNASYVGRLINDHSKLLMDELHLDEAQREATVRDDERNLVIAGAGSGKTRTLIARIRFLLERGVPPSAILAVTFTKKATEEMEDRLKQMQTPVADVGRVGVTVSTLHALGKRAVQATLPEPISVADDHWTETLVAAALRDARTGRDSRLSHLYVNAVIHFHRHEDERAPLVGGDVTYRTLRGEHVRSLGERIIADFLLTHHVPYKYEAKASWANVGAGRDAYHPDFTLTETGACIEYWGVNRQGEVPAGWATTSAMYRQHMDWKRAEFRRAGEVLIEFYDYERTEGTLESMLSDRLTRANVPMRPMTLDELEASFRDMKYIGSAIEQLIGQFLSNARSLRLQPDEIRNRLSRASPRVYHFGLLGIAILERYQAGLKEEGRIDFSDMLHRAADVLEKNRNPLPPFQHILVDEFQDTSAAMARFLKALLAVNGARLFAVGDDWQAIYGFAGGDVDHIVNFEAHFGPASTTILNVNYRSPAVIVEAGSALIAHNPKQIPKRIVVSSASPGEAYVHEVPDDDSELVAATIRLIQEERRGRKPEEILVLSRTNHLLAPIIEACRRNRIPIADPERNVVGVRVLSGHKAKGLEAPVVIVVNASDHLLGFPSKVENPDVLEPVRMSTGNDAAEERRLFYVAITRAMERLHLVAREGLPSPYLAEIEDGVTDGNVGSKAIDSLSVRTGTRFSSQFYVERLYPLTEKQTAAGIRQAGLLSTKTGRFAFTSWAPFNLEEGSMYWLGGVVKDQPFRDQQRLRLDRRTSAERRSTTAASAPSATKRALRPRPPPALQPRLLHPSGGEEAAKGLTLAVPDRTVAPR